MNHESDMKHESRDEPNSSADERDQHQNRKPWITPVVSESPVNELTAAASAGTGTDNVIYS